MPWRSFNPHTHTGCDCTWHPVGALLLRFQSTHPYRVWPPSSDSLLHELKFQSTHPYRVWLIMAVPSPLSASFNPHTHTGCDAVCAAVFSAQNGFNPHTHTGCDDQAAQCESQRLVSIHTPIQGVTDTPAFACSDHWCFNPHTHTGCDSGWWR